MSQVRHSQTKDAGNGQKAPIVNLFEQVGLQKILSLLESEDADVRIHAVKVVANLAAEGKFYLFVMFPKFRRAWLFSFFK